VRVLLDSISDVVEDYKSAYEEAGHLVLKIRVGLQVNTRDYDLPHVALQLFINDNLGLEISVGVSDTIQCRH
jgi:hypothetical protein